MFVLAISPGVGFDEGLWGRVLASGIDALMIREKHLETRGLLELTRRAQDLAPELELWVNGRLDVALAASCGLHAPETYPEAPADLLPLSRPIHDFEQMQDRMDAIQWILSPIFQVPGKNPAWGAKKLHHIMNAMPPFKGRVLALGGITAENAGDLRHPRLHGVAMVRALWQSKDPKRLVTQLRQSWAE